MQKPEDFVSLNFKVPRDFRSKMKVLAAKQATTMTKLLYEGFALVEREYGNGREANGGIVDAFATEDVLQSGGITPAPRRP